MTAPPPLDCGTFGCIATYDGHGCALALYHQGEHWCWCGAHPGDGQAHPDPPRMVDVDAVLAIIDTAWDIIDGCISDYDEGRGDALDSIRLKIAAMPSYPYDWTPLQDGTPPMT